jgi:DMSO/TMAO reductase YedYZ molybdopterin-dependent catalytic subunit
MRLSRRNFFRIVSGAGLATSLPLLSVDRPKQNMIIRSVRPEDFEMPLEGFGSWITPVEHFFVRTHLFKPSIDVAKWQLRIDGEVNQPVTLSMEELKKFPRAELVSVLECAGNGRAFYQPTVIGLQWRYGAVGNARWSGVRLADVLHKAGLKSSAKHILFNGADVPIGTMPDFERTIPLNKALDSDTLLATEMNGEALPSSHGFPLRLVAPGWAGDSWVKWITNIQVLDKEFEGFFMKTAYRHPVHPVSPGATVDPAEMTPVEAVGPKSLIAAPAQDARLPQSEVRIHGAAWSGGSPITRVDVSTDNGRNWHPAKLGADRAKYAWRLWETTWKPAGPGSYVLMARATDESGDTQPLSQEWNPSGYLWNVVQQVRVDVGAQQVATASTSENPVAPRPAFPEKVKSACIGCHEADVIEGQKLTRTQWEREVDKMVRWGAKVEDRSALIDFLASHFGPRP